MRDDVGERDRVGHAEVGGERVERPPVEPGALPADERETRPRVVDAPVHREREEHVVLALVRRDAPDREPVGAAGGAGAPALGEERRVGRRVVVGEVDQDRRDRGVLAPELHELLLVEGRVGERETHGGCRDRELPPPVEHRGGCARLPAPEVLRVGDVVVVERERHVELACLFEERVADREVVEDPRVVAPAQAGRKRARGQRLVADVVVRVDRVDLGLEAGVAQQPPQAQRVHPDRVSAGERREELVDRGHSEVPSSLRRRASRSRTRSSSCSMRAAAAFPTDVVAQPNARSCSVTWLVVKNTALRTTFLASVTPRLREVTGASASTSVCSSRQRERGPDVVGRRGAQREPRRLLVHPVDVLGGEAGLLRGAPRRRLDLDAHVASRQNDGRERVRSGCIDRAVVRHGSNASGRMRDSER